MPPRATSPSGCGAAYIWNPRTTRCVLRTGAVGRRLVALELRMILRNEPPRPAAAAPVAGRPCGAGQVRNPATGRCVSRGGNIGRRVRFDAGNVLTPRPARRPRPAPAVRPARPPAPAVAALPPAAAAAAVGRPCPPNQVRNPESGRCVSRTGAIGRRVLRRNTERRRLLNAAARVPLPGARPATPATPARPGTPASPLIPMTPLANAPSANNLRAQCINDGDPVMLENFKNMNADDLKSIVKIGPGPKKHCFLLDSIYQVYKTAADDNRPVKNPLNPSHILTKAELRTIDRMMLARDPSYRPPQRTMMNYMGYELDIAPNGNYFRLRIVRRGVMAMDLGYIPGDIEVRNTGSADTTSAAMISALRELWDQRRMLRSADPLRVVGMIHLRKSKDFWRGADKINKFRELMGEIQRFRG